MVSSQLNYLEHRKLRPNKCSRLTLYSWGFKKTFQLSNTSWVAHFAQGFCFDLANPLASDLELPTHFLQGSAVPIDQAKSLLEHLSFSISERLQHVLDFFLQQNNGGHIARIFGASIFDKVPKIRFFALTYRRLQRNPLFGPLFHRRT